MNKPQVTGVGTVQKFEFVSPERGKPFLSVTIKMTVREFGEGKQYAQKVNVRTYVGTMQAIADSLTVGGLAWFSGEGDAHVEEYQGKSYANIRVTGLVGPVVAQDVTQRKQAPAAPAPQRQPAARTAAPARPAAPSPAADDAHDDVPF